MKFRQSLDKFQTEFQTEFRQNLDKIRQNLDRIQSLDRIQVKFRQNLGKFRQNLQIFIQNLEDNLDKITVKFRYIQS